MLLSLYLKNFVLVDELELDFDSGLTVLTGETGAGKSILLNALNLILGGKSDSSFIRKNEMSTEIHASFSVDYIPGLMDLLLQQEFIEAESNDLLIKRILYQNGKNKNFINGKMVTLSELKQIGSYLIGIHGQNEQQSLLNEKKQCELLDHYAGNEDLLKELLQCFSEWKKLEKDLIVAINHSKELDEEKELLEWKIKELKELDPKPLEWDELSHDYDRLSHASELINTAQEVESILVKQKGVIDLVLSAQKKLSPLLKIEPLFQESDEIFQSIENEINEISYNMRDIYGRIDIDNEELNRLELRMGEMSALAKKYQIEANHLSEKLNELIDRRELIEKKQDIDKIQNNVNLLIQKYDQIASQLTTSRKRSAKTLAEETTKVIRNLAMEHAEFQVTLIPAEKTAQGQEKISFSMLMNLGGDVKPINKIASGGELSRISLALEVVLSKFTQISTLIFDEVDSGIGGRVSDMVGKNLKELAKQHQVILVTHAPQIAVYGEHHFLVKKEIKEDQTSSNITILTHGERVEEIARMLGGEIITDITKNHAEEMLSMTKHI